MASAQLTPTPAPTSSRGQWMALTAALLGWMFDGLEMGLWPLVGRPALQDLLATATSTPDDEAIGLWMGVMTAGFLVGAATGGVLFGWLGDRLGRVRAMALSVLTYALFTGLCGVSQTVEQVFLFRVLAALGMGGEWSLGVSLVMEIWPNRSRGWLAGVIGAAANVGFMLIAIVSLGMTQVVDSLEALLRLTGLPDAWTNELIANSAWRLLMLFGAAPALLTFLIRLFVPESERWLHERAQGNTSHWATKDLLAVLLGALGPLGIIYVWAWDHSLWVRLAGTVVGLTLALWGYTFPVVGYLRRSAATRGLAGQSSRDILGRMLVGAGLSGVALLGTWGSMQWAPTWADKLVEDQMKQIAGPPGTTLSTAQSSELQSLKATRSRAKEFTQIAAGFGAILGTIVAALLGSLYGRRLTYTGLCLGSVLSILLFYQANSVFGPLFLATVFLAGCVTASFYGWLPLYLPELFGTSVRATGQGFAFNFGRIIAAVGALQTGYLTKEVFQGNYPTACSIMSLIYLAGVVLIWFAPETHGQELPE